MGDLRSEILAVGAGLKDRLDAAIVDDALEYLDFNEYDLAVLVLCQQLNEFNVPLKQDEFNNLARFIRKLNVDTDLFGDIEKLVQDKTERTR
jgi:hypothetical protein